MRQVLVVFVLLLAGCSPPPPLPAAPTPNVSATVETQVRATVAAAIPTPRPTGVRASIGQDGWIYAIKSAGGGMADWVPFTGTAADSIAYRKAIQANDDVGVQNLFAKYKFFRLTVGTHVLVIDLMGDLAEVRLIDGGLYAQMSGWTEQSWVLSRLPSEFVQPSPVPLH